MLKKIRVTARPCSFLSNLDLGYHFLEEIRNRNNGVVAL